MKNENWIDINDGKISGFEFFQLVLAEFPQLECEINEWEQTYIHMKMEIFAEYTIKQIESNNILELTKCFNFIESKIDELNLDIENALNVSYCESLLLGDAADEMYRIINLMPTKLKTIYLDYKQHYLNLMEKQNE